MSWWPRPPTPPTAVVDPSPITATFTASLGPPARAPAPGNSRGTPSPRPAAIEPLKKLRRGIALISLLTTDLGWFGVTDAPGLRADGYVVPVAGRPAGHTLTGGPGRVDSPPELTLPGPVRRHPSRCRADDVPADTGVPALANSRTPSSNPAQRRLIRSRT